MKILFLVSSMGGGGAERVAASLCNAWATRGDDVTIMPTFSRGGDIHYDLDSRVKVEFLSDKAKGRRSKAIRLLVLRRYLIRSTPDVVISFITDVNIAALLAGIGTKTPIIVSERTYPPLLSPPSTPLIRFLRRVLYPRAAKVVVQTGDTAGWIRRECPECRVAVIPNPVAPLNAATKTDSANARKLVLAAGRLIPSKRLEILQESFASLIHDFPEWDLCILGEGPSRASLQKKALELKLESRMLMPGFSRTPSNWFSRADIYVLTSSYEGMPNALIEAMACGVAPIAFDIKTGPRDILKDGEHGVLLPDDSHVERLTKAMRCLMANETKRKALGARARYVLDDYAMPKVLDEWDLIIQEAIRPARLRETESN